MAVGLWDALFGRTRLKKPQLDPLFALSAAAPDLATRGLEDAGETGLCYRREDSPAFDRCEERVRELMALYAKDHPVHAREEVDALQFRWWVLTGSDLADRVTALHLAAEALQEDGFSEALLAAVFALKDTRRRPVFFIYNYKRGRFYPFVPTGREERDNARELHAASLARGLIPVEEEMERWYALWDMPLGR